MSNIHRHTVTVALAVAALVAGMLISRSVDDERIGAAGAAATSQSVRVLEAPRILPDVQLRDATDSAWTPANLAGRWTLVFFGFTSCPDVCPDTLYKLSGAVGQLPEDLRPTVLMVSVDPMRDTPEDLGRYVKWFNPAFEGVVGTNADIARLQTFANAMGAAFTYTPTEDGAYTVDHSAAVFLTNPDGHLAAIFSTPHEPARMAEDLRRILGADAGDQSG